MNWKCLPLLLLGCVTILGAGCYSTVEGRSKAGVPFAKDTITSRYERSVEQLRTASRRVLRFNGELQRDDLVTNVLSAKVNNRMIYVKLVEEEPNLTMVRVQARREGGAPDIDLASEIDKQIALQLPR